MVEVGEQSVMYSTADASSTSLGNHRELYELKVTPDPSLDLRAQLTGERLGPDLPLAEAARAHELRETGAASGKIILVPWPREVRQERRGGRARASAGSPS